jgi:multidrug efflux system outer membrane protein
MVKEAKRSKLRRISPVLIVVSICLLISSCAIHPQTLKKQTIWLEAQKDVQELKSKQEPVQESITLYHAMARAIKYNREYRLGMMKSALSMQQAELSRFDMLPDLALNAGYASRNNKLGSSSESYTTGVQTLEPSVSQDKERRNFDATFTWNVLDFGLSYVIAQQQADRFLIAKEAERKTVQNIINDVRSAWWRALSAQRLLAQVPALMNKVQKALDSSEQIEAQRLETPLTALNYQRSLLNMLRTLEGLRRDLNQAKPQLAYLMGLSMDQNFAIAEPVGLTMVKDISWDVKTMEKIALLARPELLERHYQQRISQKESRLALLSLLPNLNLDAGWNYDSNSYLVKSNWYDFGAQISGSLMNLIKMPATLRNAETSEELNRQQRLVISATVLMQVHLAKAAHIQSERSFELEDQAFGVESRILKQKRDESATESEGVHSLIGQQLNHLLSQLRRDGAYAELRNNFGRLLWTMGIDPIPAGLTDISVSGLANNIEASMDKWQKGSLGDVEVIDTYLPLSLGIHENR